MKLRGSTLVESLVALLVIVTIVAISLIILVNSAKTSTNDLELKGMVYADFLISESIAKKDFNSEVITKDGVEFEKSISFVNRYNGILKIEITARANENEFYNTERFIYLED